MDVNIVLCVFSVLFNFSKGHYRTYIGCFQDSSTRVLPSDRFDSSSHMTNDRCAQHCCLFTEGTTYSGTELNKECWCGNRPDILSVPQLSESACYSQCSGNQSEYCGGSFRISISKLNCSEIQHSSRHDSSAVEPTVIIPNVDIDAKIAAITEQIRVDKRQTGAYKRTKVSAYDDRKSVQYIGVGGILVMVLPIITVILSDIMNLFKCKNKSKMDKKDPAND